MSGGLLFAGAAEADASVRSFSNINLTYNGGHKQAGNALTKSTTSKSGALNLTNDTGTAWIIGTLRNSEGSARGTVRVQRGKRATFTTTAQQGYSYRMFVHKENPGTVTIRGSWTADN